ncbi:lipocalin family protein [Chryseobacterium arthrosphaerae]|uniref:lipocalin family protein n=1 Tax=Chryseobacterium arthrosphaerae TaxID=651561 RepID=UPI0023E2351F|nr:lipocalin family protein [Chryseobacterium arthrosphaerae]WES97105.1 lipocalin family protein [Chryseobacterium arthrosphaerae]
MKKALFTLTVCLLTFNSCRSDSNDNSTTNEPTVVGTWKVVKIAKISGKDNTVISSKTNLGCTASNTFQFTNDNKFTFKLYDTPNNTPCSLVETSTGTYTYNKSTKVLTFTYSNNSTENLQVNSLTSSELVTVENLNADYNGDNINDKEFAYLNKQ